MNHVSYDFCLRVVECLPFSRIYGVPSVEAKTWLQAIEDAPAYGEFTLTVYLLCLESKIWKYAIHDSFEEAMPLTIQELTKKPNFKDYRVESLVIQSDIGDVDVADMHPLDRPLGAFLDVISFLANKLSLKIETPTPLNPVDESTILEHLDNLSCCNIDMSTYTAAYHNLIQSYLSIFDYACLRPYKFLSLTSADWPEETLTMLMTNIRSGKMRQLYIDNNPPWSFEFFEHLFKMVETDVDSFKRHGWHIRAIFEANMKSELDKFRKESSEHVNDCFWRWHLATTEKADGLILDVTLDADNGFFIVTDNNN